MKALKRISIVLLSFVLFTTCSKDSSDPETQTTVEDNNPTSNNDNPILQTESSETVFEEMTKLTLLDGYSYEEFMDKTGMASDYLDIRDSVYFDSDLNKTVFTLSISPMNTTVNNVSVVLYVPKEVANSVSDIEFSVPPTTIILDDPVTMWHLEGIVDTEFSISSSVDGEHESIGEIFIITENEVDAESYVHIPDDNFRQALIDLEYPVLDIYGVWFFFGSVISNTEYLDLTEKGINDLKGIELFEKLIGLNCDKNELTEIDLSKNKDLEWLSAFDNNIQDIDISKNTKLTSLVVAENQLSQIDVSNNDLLEVFSIWGNNLSTLDVVSNTNLEYLSVSFNQLSELNIGSNINLTELYCSENNLSTLNLYQNPELEKIAAGDNKLTSLDFSQNILIKSILVGSNELSSINIADNPMLNQLNVQDNNLNILDVSGNYDLEVLLCYLNEISTLDLTSNTKLKKLFAGQGKFESVVTNSLEQLEELFIDNCEISSLDISNNYLLSRLFIFNNNNLDCITVNQEQLNSNLEIIDDVLKDDRLVYNLDCDAPNDSPNAPTNPYPGNNTIINSSSLTLSWEANDPNGNQLKFDINFGTTSNTSLIEINYDQNSYELTNLQNGQTYAWRVTCRDEYGYTTTGDWWFFTINF